MSGHNVTPYLSLVAALLFVAAAAGADPTPAPQSPLIFHSSFSNAASITNPEVARRIYSPPGNALPGPTHVMFEPGLHGTAARIDARGFGNFPIDGPIRFRGENFDTTDAERNGGRLDFLVKFNEDIHRDCTNRWLIRSNWSNSESPFDRLINFEWSGNGCPIPGSNPPRNDYTDMMADIYSPDGITGRLRFNKFRLAPEDWPAYENIAQDQWHWFTWTWRNNGLHKDEMHLYIDGMKQGCTFCDAYNGNLPGFVSDLFLAPFLTNVNQVILFSIDEIYSFNSWDVSGVQGNFPTLENPDRIELKYPQDKDYPWWGSTVPSQNVLFEFSVYKQQAAQFSCNLKIDGSVATTIQVTNGAHTEVRAPAPLSQALHTWQIECGSLASPVWDFVINVPTNCTNGQRDGSETGVDCGGNCDLCPQGDSVPPTAPLNFRRN